MNIIAMRQETRRNQINQISASIRKAMDEGKTIDKTSVIMATASNIGLSLRTSKEYVEIAMFEINQNA